MRSKLLEDFKEFAVKGNMIDIAIGVIIGNAFNKVVDVLVKEVFLPPLSLMTDGINWGNKKVVLREAVTGDGVPNTEEIAIGYGRFLEVSVDFLIISMTVFLVVKLMNSLRREADDPKNKKVATPKNIELLDSINDHMERQNKLLEELSAQK